MHASSLTVVISANNIFVMLLTGYSKCFTSWQKCLSKDRDNFFYGGHNEPLMLCMHALRRRALETPAYLPVTRYQSKPGDFLKLKMQLWQTNNTSMHEQMWWNRHLLNVTFHEATVSRHSMAWSTHDLVPMARNNRKLIHLGLWTAPDWFITRK